MQEAHVQYLSWEDALEREWQHTPAFLPRESHGQRRLAVYSTWGCRELDMTEWLSTRYNKCLGYGEREHLYTVAFSDPVDVGNLICGSSGFCKPSLYIWKFSMHILLKPNLKDFEHNLTSMCCCCCLVASVVSDSVRPHRLKPTRCPRPWGSPGKNTGVGCHFLHPDKTIIWKDTCISVFIAALLTIAKTRKQPKCPSTGEWVTKRWYIYTVEFCSAIKKNETQFAATWMDLGIMILNEVRKGKTNTMWYHLYMESKIWHKWTCEWNKHRLTERTDLWLTRGRRAGGGKDWKFGINRSKLLLFICRTDKQWGPTYSTENCIPYPVRNHNGKKYEKEYIYV